MENENKVVPETTVNEATENETKQPVAENRCPNCQALLGEGQTFCPECGTPLKKLCQRCGAKLQEGQAFCDKCGQRADGTIDANTNSAINQFNTNVSVQQQKNKRIPIIIGGVCVAVVAVALIFGKVGGGVDFEKKFAYIAEESWCDIASDGSYMKLDTNPDDVDSDSYKFDYDVFIAANEAIENVNKELGFSDSLNEKMNTTTWSQGKQTDENDKFKVTWTYHPDKGLEVMYEKK